MDEVYKLRFQLRVNSKLQKLSQMIFNSQLWALRLVWHLANESRLSDQTREDRLIEMFKIALKEV